MAERCRREWYSHTPGRSVGSTGEFNPVTFMTQMGQIQLGGELWLQQFTRGIPIAGDLSQSGVYPTGKRVGPSPDPNIIWGGTATRYTTRATVPDGPMSGHCRAKPTNK